MSSTVLASIEVVNSDIENSATHPVPFGIVSSGLRERIDLLVTRVGGSQRELSRRSGLTEVHVGQILRRLKADPDASIESATLRAIARGAKVSEAWLLTGKGSPDDADDVRSYETAPVTPRTTGVRDRVATYGTDRPFWRDLPDWPQLLAAAKLEDPDMPEAVWKKIERDLHYELDEEPTPSTLVGAAVWVRKNTRYWKLPTTRPETGGQPAATGTKGK